AHERWRSAQRHLGQLIVSGAAHPEDPGTRARFETARLEADEAERRFVLLASAGWAPKEVELAEILGRLEPNQTLVAFATGSQGAGTKQTLGAFVARGADRSSKWIQLGRTAEIENLVEDWLRGLGRPPSDPKNVAAEEAACRKLGQKVRDRVWQPIEKLFAGANEVFIVPEGVVHEVPWLALPETKGRYLADGSITIRIIDAERDLLLPSQSSGDRLLALGGPDFDQDATAALVTDRDPSRAWRCTGTETLALSPLPAAKAEAVDVAEMWSSSSSTTVLLGMDASEPAFKAQASGHAVIHIATHGVMLDDSCSTYRGATRGVGGLEPVASATPAVQSSKKKPVQEKPSPQHPWLGRQVWLALSGANRPPEMDQDENEGLLTAEEVLTLDLRGTEWVVLSACHSAAATNWSREGVVGMQRSFHLAGASSVIASHWSIGD
ncbi:MAG TPA: CHAT domain-containing protein, partial [Candidatus Eisenbacteria bacterium]|nr:CHAT domain-containing protein [Candidatus Eisenbacteria bacterium]